MKKKISLLLCLCMILPTLAACSDSGDTDSTETEQNAVTTPSTDESAEDDAAEEESKWAAVIPEGTNYEGMTFTIACFPFTGETSWIDVDWSATDLTGEILNDAVYTRTSTVEELLNVDIVPSYVDSVGDSSSLNTSVTANDNAYQLYQLIAGSVINAATSRLVQDINAFANEGTLDLTSAWWDQNSLKDLSIANRVFCLTGDIGTMYKKSIGVIMFNKDIVTKNILESPYEAMSAGQWTVDKMVEMGSKISNDLDGNGVMDENDQYGLICFRDMLPLAMIGCDVPFFSKDENDLPLNTFYSERSVSVIEKLATLMYDTNLTFSTSKNNISGFVADDMFRADKSLFYYGELKNVVKMRDMESAFGVMPMPKYDETQANYYHCINPNVAAVYVIPATNIDYERTGYIMDALGAESKNELTPAYYETTLHGKVSRDEESSASLDIIINNIRYDIGYIGNWGINGTLYSMADAGIVDLASQFERLEKSINKSIEKTVGNLEDAFGE